MFVSRKWIGALCLSASSGLAVPALAQTALEPATGQSTVERARTTTPGQPSDPSQTLPGSVPRTTPQTVPGSRANTDANLNQEIAVWILLGNEEEVALGQFAESRAQHPEVKKFAQQMVEHHRQVIQKVQEAAPETAGHNLQLKSTTNPRGAASATPTSQASGVRTASAETPIAAPQANHNQQGVQLAQAIKQECLNLTEQELGQKQGVEFDKAYIGQQIGAHMGMLAQLRGSRQFASGDLKPLIDEGEKMTQQHLDQAKQIMAQLKDKQGPATQTSQRPATATQPAR